MKSIVNRLTNSIQRWPQRIAVTLSILSFSITPVFAECFQVNGDGTLSDSSTGLIWQACALGQVWNGGACTGNPEEYSWKDALVAAHDNQFQNKVDWIVPTIEQLKGVGHDACDHRKARWTKFATSYWSSSMISGQPYVAYAIYDYHPSEYSRDARLSVRLVRSSQLADIGIFKDAYRYATDNISEYRDRFQSVQSSSDLANFINTYRNNDPDNLTPKAEAMRQAALKREATEEIARQLQVYRLAFKNAYTSSEFESFISTYNKNDSDKLIPKAEAKKRIALAREQQEAQRQTQIKLRENERRSRCEHIYVGKVFSGAGGVFGITQEYEVVGFSASSSMATIKSGSYKQEVSCSSIP